MSFVSIRAKVFVFLGCIVFSGCILQPAFAQNCIGLDGKMLKISALAKIAEENGNDRWLAIMKKGERLALLSKRLTTPWFYFSPDSEQEKVIGACVVTDFDVVYRKFARFWGCD